MRGMRQMKVLLLSLFVGGALLMWAFGAGDYLTFSNLKDIQEDLSRLFQERPITVVLGYVGIYILISAMSIPGAEVLSIAGGAVFGLCAGTIIVSFASSFGALLGCMVARYAFRAWIEQIFRKKTVSINALLDEKGPYYLFILRLVPLFPFFIVNIAAGLTRIPLFKFYWVSQLGMLPASLVFVNAGSRLQVMKSSADVLSPGVILSFALLALFPVAAKYLFDRFSMK